MYRSDEAWNGQTVHVAAVRKSKLVTMPEATFIGDLYATPEQRHPQERPLAQLYRVEDSDNDNGVYAIPVELPRGYEPHKFFLDQARKITCPLPVRTGIIPTFGANELSFDPPSNREALFLSESRAATSVLDTRKKPELRRTIETGIRKRYSQSSITAEFN